MPDTGEDRQIKRRINAKEEGVESKSKKLLQKSKSKKDETFGKFRGKNKSVITRKGR